MLLWSWSLQIFIPLDFMSVWNKPSYTNLFESAQVCGPTIWSKWYIDIIDCYIKLGQNNIFQYVWGQKYNNLAMMKGK